MGCFAHNVDVFTLCYGCCPLTPPVSADPDALATLIWRPSDAQEIGQCHECADHLVLLDMLSCSRPTNRCSHSISDMFMEACNARRPDLGHHRELCLATLCECGGDVDAALTSLAFAPINSLDRRHTGVRPSRCPCAHTVSPSETWTPEELTEFESAFLLYGKRFDLIAQSIGTKTRGNCVDKYYLWKKVINS